MTAHDDHKNVIVWRDDWLPGSETFIRNQASALRTWTPLCSGLQTIQSPLAEQTDRVLFARTWQGSFRRKVFKLTRRSRQLDRWVSDPAVGLVHAHFGPDATQILPFCIRAKKPLMVTLHGYDVSKFPTEKSVRAWLYRRRLRALFSYASTIVAVSEFIRQQTILLGADPGKIVVHHIGIPLVGRAKSGEGAGIVFVGRFSEKKGVLDLLEAVAMLEEPMRSTRITLVGDGPLKGGAESLADTLSLNARFCGALSPAGVGEILDEGLVFCGPSQKARTGDVEGLGMVFLEAGAHHLPVIAYRHGGVSEAVTHNEAGILVEEGDVPALAAALAEMLSNERLRAKMGQSARSRVERDFDIKRQTATLERIYESIAGE